MVSSFYILERTMREVLEIRGRSCRIQGAVLEVIVFHGSIISWERMQ
ncbi:hypothetical protein NC652_029460 [Populus alba x Populus x berolinensis]|nr:hypothetical protein NC652_029460 [Populus alba x Populus x berolinensis]